MEHDTSVTASPLSLSISDSTICAISTPPGVGGIAVIRISGPKAIDIADSVWEGKKLASAQSHTAHLGNIIDPEATAGEPPLDQAVATVYRSPRSFTGEDVVEISVHGSRWIQSRLIKILIDRGCRLAEPGEFTRRAFASGRLDLAEAEAVADVIAASSKNAHRLAAGQMRGDFSKVLETLRNQLLDLASLLELELDFSEEDVEFASREKLIGTADEIHRLVTRLASSFSTGQAIKDGIPVAIVGEPNAGKSTLLNALLQDNRAIVSNIPGTTRDTIEDTIEINGILYRFIDTAGLRNTPADEVEALGIGRTLDKISQARIVIWVLPPDFADLGQLSSEITSRLSADTALIVAINKIDITSVDRDKITTAISTTLPQSAPTIFISAHTGQNLDQLQSLLHDVSGADLIDNADVIVTNARHYEALVSAKTSITRVIDGLHTGLSGDFIAQDLRETIHHLGTITGTITTPEILTTIFTRFCIGK